MALVSDHETLSPELVLVASPEEAARARALLPSPPSMDDVRRVAAAPAPPPAFVEPRPRARLPLLLLAGAVVLVLGGATAWSAVSHRSSSVPTATAAPAPTTATAPAATTARPPAAAFVPSRVWLWRDAGAKAYQFELALGTSVVLTLRTTEPRAVLPPSFRFQAGTYRWTVRALPLGNAPPVTYSKFTVTADAARLANG